MKNFTQVGILKVVKMIIPMVDTLSQVGNLKETMLKMIFLQVSIFKVLMMMMMEIFLQVRILKALMRMTNSFPQVGILKVVKMIMSMVDNFFHVGNLKAPMVMMLFFLQANILEALKMVLLI
jgi:hypothetical protein